MVCGLIKRRVCEDTENGSASSWDEKIDKQAVEIARSIAKELERLDPVCGFWCVKG